MKGVVVMNKDRAAEIISSSLDFEVLWDNKPVWLEAVNTVKDTAEIVILGSHDKREVPINELTETGNFE